MTGRSILDGLNTASKAGVKATPSARFRTKEIDIDNIYRNVLNQYSLDDVDSLARAILVAGRLYHNLVVVYDPALDADYRLVSGERRLLALHKLVDAGHPEYKTVTCQVIPKGSQAEERLAVILANTQRNKTAADRVQEYENLKQALEEMRAAGVDFYGRDLTEGKLRDHMAAIMDEADGTLAALEKISNSLAPELRQLMEDGKLNFTTATAAAALSMDAQAQLVQQNAAQGEDKPITKQDVAKARTTSAREYLRSEYAARPCECDNSHNCDNVDNLVSFYRDGATSGCAGCCAWCKERTSCPKCCAEVAAGSQSDADTPLHGAPDRIQPPTSQTAENAAEDATAAAAPFADDAHPEHAATMCYSCLHWDECSEKSDRVLSCDKYENPAEKRTPLAPAGEITTTQADAAHTLRTDEELVNVLYAALGTLEYQGQINELEARRLHSLLSAMHRRWINTGCWKPYGAAEEQDEKERRKSQDVNS